MQNKIDLPWLAGQGFVSQAKDLLQENEDVNQRSVGGRTALINAAATDKMNMILLLLEYNADLNIQDNHGDTALMRAVVEGYTPIVSLLLEHGAAMDLQEKYGNTALMIAADNVTASSENVHMQIASLLLQHGADPTLVNKKGKTALDLVFRSKVEEFQHLIDEYYHPTSFRMS